MYGLGLISKIVGNNAYFYQYDTIGSTVSLSDKDGNLKNKYAYDDFGNLAVNSTETVANPFKYVGRFGVMTDTPDLLYMRARYYMPSVGRFINKDPIGLRGGMNLYGYVGGNPIGRIDPTGLGGAGGGWCNIEPWWQPTPGRTLRWTGRILQEMGYRISGKTLGIAGVVLEPGGTGKIAGIIIGGAIGAAIGSAIPIPGAPVVLSIAGGTFGGWFGSQFDYPGEGYLNYDE